MKKKWRKMILSINLNSLNDREKVDSNFCVDIMKIISSTRSKIYSHSYSLIVFLCRHENDFLFNVLVESCVKFTWFHTRQFTNLTNYLNRLRLTFSSTLWTSSEYDAQIDLSFLCRFLWSFDRACEWRMSALVLFFNQFETIEQFIDW